MARKSNEGVCHICGTFGPLTFEHVPPEAAFNDRPVVRPKFMDIVGKGPDEEAKGKIQQRGAGGYTLCARCNNNTGQWYAKDFVDWCYQSALFLAKAPPSGLSLMYPYHIFPLRVIKQVVCMFFSVNNPGLASKNPQLVKFVLNRDEKYIDPRLRIYCFLTKTPIGRSSGISAVGGARSMSIFSELSFPPLGFVMTFNSPPPDERLLEITSFSRYDYNFFDVFFLKAPILETHLYLPGDYRTKEQIYNDYQENMKFIE